MKAVLLVISMGCFFQGFTQQSYFVLIQSEKSQPFYARLEEKNYSSSAIGHLILSNLKDSAYTIIIGFPQNRFPEQEFLVRISKKDRGYQLKNLGDKGWALFDTRTMELIPPVKPEKASSGGTAVYIKKNDDFARLMAGVVNDTAVLYAMVEEVKPPPAVVATGKPEADVAVQKKEEIKKEEVIVPKQEGSEVAKKPEPEVVVPKTNDVAGSTKKTSDPVVPKEVKQDSVITKPVEEVKLKEPEQKPVLPVVMVVDQYNTDTGYHMVVVDELKDSIRIFIPSDPAVKEKEIAKKEEPAPQTKTPDEIAPGTSAVKADSVHKEVLNAKIINEKKTSSADTAKKETKLVMINSDCRSFAASNDVDKLRVKLLQEKDAGARIAAAKKVFRTKCFNAQQIRGLTELFPYDDQKYLFLEAAYPFVSDTGNFKELGLLLSEPVYYQRFRKLVRLD